jgi:hypothetical protein
VFRRSARNSEMFFKLIGEKIWQEFQGLARIEFSLFATCEKTLKKS